MNGGTPALTDMVGTVTWTTTGLVPVAASNPKRTGYDFDGWTVTSGGKGVVPTNASTYGDLAASAATMEITITANWKVKGGYSVKYIMGGGTPAPADKVGTVTWNTTGLVPAAASNPTRTGYDFNGWTVSAGGKGVVPTDASSYSDLAANDTTMEITITANWAVKTGYSVKYVMNGGTPAQTDRSGNVAWNTTGLVPVTSSNPTRTGYDFTGWTVTSGGNGTTPTNASSYGDLALNDTTMEITITANWTVKTGYTVKYEMNGGTPVQTDRKRKWNEGEVDQYYHTGTHDAIIEPEIFDFVQVEMERRQALGKSYSGKDPFSCRIVCGECGGLYGPKVWYSNTKYRRTIFRCNRKYEKGKAPCSTPHFSEDDIKRAFVSVFNRMLENKDTVLDACRDAVAMISDTGELEAAIDQQTDVVAGFGEQIKALIARNASIALDQAQYGAEYDALAQQYGEANDRLSELDDALRERQRRCAELLAYLTLLESTGDLVTVFDERLWNFTVDTVTVQGDGTLRFCFKDGEVLEHK